jgi:hypothetical protein
MVMRRIILSNPAQPDEIVRKRIRKKESSICQTKAELLSASFKHLLIDTQTILRGKLTLKQG